MITMKRLGLMAFFLVSLLPAVQADIPLPEGHKVRMIVSQVLEHYRAHGAQATFDKLNAGWTRDGQYYAFINRVSDGTIVAHAADPGLVGKNHLEVINSEGRYVIQEIITMASGMGDWIEYKWVNPATGMDEDKRTWSMRIDDYVICSGYYL